MKIFSFEDYDTFILPLCGFYLYFSKCSPIFEQAAFQNTLQNFICTSIFKYSPQFASSI